ncbi:MAG: polysaccharide biosynthesis/export family protein [Verrucomicrobiota bacterium]
MKTPLLLLLCIVYALPLLGQTPKDASPGSAPSSNYRLSANDLVQVKVFQEDDLDATLRISKDGTIQFPLIGSARIGGRTVQEAALTMEAALREYLTRPQVAIRVMEYSKRRFTVLGQVMKPGAYEMPEDQAMNLLEAIGIAGGYTRIANPAKVILKRKVNGAETIFKLNAKTMATDGENKRFDVLPGDTILVGESIL